jgi:hypothetical protein
MGGRVLASGFTGLVLALLGLKLAGVGGFEDNLDATALVMLGLAIVLGFIALSPGEAKEILGRLTTLRVAGVEIGLQAAERLERVELRTADLFDDDVEAVKPRPIGGSATEEFDVVSEKLRERLEIVRDEILGLKHSRTTLETVHMIKKRRLLKPDEEQVVSDLLGDSKENVVRLTGDVRKRYLDGAWRFASRFATLILERRVRKAMVGKKWLLLDFDQARSHRPDFLAFRDGVWLLVATRRKPGNTEKVRKRLSEQTVPHEAHKVVVYPNKHAAEALTVEDYPDVELVPFSKIASYRG